MNQKIKKPIISIILPVYNVEQFLEESIKSILENTFKDFELIIVDDGSKDNSGKIIDSFLSDNRVVVVKKENGGLSSARNLGIKIAKGEYITFIDSDDAVSEFYLEYLYKGLSLSNADIVYCKYSSFYKIKKMDRPEFNFCVQKNDVFYSKENYTFKVISCAKLFKKEIFNTLKFETGRLHEDEFLFNKIHTQNFTFCFVDCFLYFYRKNPNSITNSIISNERNIDRIDCFIERFKLVQDQKKFTLSYRNYIENSLINVAFNCVWKNDKKNYKKNFFKKKIRKLLWKYRSRKNNLLRNFLFLFPGFIEWYFYRSQRKKARLFFIKMFIRPKLVYLGSITHGNLGDQAICVAALKLLKENGFRVVDFTTNEVNSDVVDWIKKKKLHIILRGGGNIGDTWIEEENFNRRVVNAFPNNKILFFPNSVYFSDSEQGTDELLQSSEIYHNHKNCVISVRDKVSYDRATKYFDNKILLIPDTVFYLKNRLYIPSKRNKALFLLRNDSEYIDNKDKIEFLKLFLKKSNFSLDFSSTVLDRNVPRRTRKKELNRFNKKIKRHDLIITDRLHGFVFAYNNGVPCIVLNNKTNKVFPCADWILESNLIYKYDDNNEEILFFISNLKSIEERKINLNSSFKQLLEELK